jgi:hypothetical protein
VAGRAARGSSGMTLAGVEDVSLSRMAGAAKNGDSDKVGAGQWES